eukprot:870496-Rhodomonas_salina.3
MGGGEVRCNMHSGRGIDGRLTQSASRDKETLSRGGEFYVFQVGLLVTDCHRGFPPAHGINSTLKMGAE